MLQKGKVLGTPLSVIYKPNREIVRYFKLYIHISSTAISMEEPAAVVTQEQIFENIHLHKEVLGSVKQQPLSMRRKLKIVHQVNGSKLVTLPTIRENF